MKKIFKNLLIYTGKIKEKRKKNIEEKRKKQKILINNALFDVNRKLKKLNRNRPKSLGNDL